MIIALPLVLSFISGMILMSLIFPQENLKKPNPLQFWMALGLGLGFSSCAHFLLLYFFGLHQAVFWTDLSLMLLLGSIYLFRRRLHKKQNYIATGLNSKPPAYGLLSVYIGVWFLALIFFIRRCWLLPHGVQDSWAIWKMHAKFLHLGGAEWQSAYNRIPEWSHPDYPLLLPCLLARAWEYAGLIFPAAGIVIAFIFMFLTSTLLVSSISKMNGKNNGLLAGILLVGTPLFALQGAAQIADIPLSFFLLASLVSWNLAGETLHCKRYLVLSGVMAGLAAWTKNEGTLFCLAIPLAFLLSSAILKEKPFGPQKLIYFVAGAAPILAVVLLFKLSVGGENTTLWFPEKYGAAPGDYGTKLLDLSRHWLILKSFLREFFVFGMWKISIPAILILYFFFYRTKKMDTVRKFGLSISWLTLGLILAGYELTYTLTPLELKWHLGSSLDRLFLQLWPSALFCFFLMVRDPLSKSV